MKKILAVVIMLIYSMALFAGGSAEQDGTFELISSTSQLIGASTQLLQENLTKVFEEAGATDFTFKHYNSATLFKSSAELGALLDGNIDVGYIQLNYFYDNGAEWANMYDTAFLFSSVEQMMEVLSTKSEDGKDIQQKIWDEFHVWLVCPFYLGARDIWLSEDIDVNTPEDLNGVKMRVANSGGFLDMGMAIGVAPTPLDSSEVYLSMQTGTIDAQENIILSSWANAIQEVTETIVLTNHMITANYICVNGDVWEKMTPAQQAQFTELCEKAVEINNEQVLAEEGLILKTCEEEYGIRLQTPDITAFKEHAKEYYLSKPENVENWNLDAYNAILGI